jgi:hypothetical protein
MYVCMYEHIHNVEQVMKETENNDNNRDVSKFNLNDAVPTTEDVCSWIG